MTRNDSERFALQNSRICDHSGHTAKSLQKAMDAEIDIVIDELAKGKSKEKILRK
jgi:hypothetical protein